MADFKVTAVIGHKDLGDVVGMLEELGVRPTLEHMMKPATRKPSPIVETPPKKKKPSGGVWHPLGKDGLTPLGAQAQDLTTILTLLTSQDLGAKLTTGAIRVEWDKTGHSPNSLGALLTRFKQGRAILPTGPKGEYVLTERGKHLIEKWREKNVGAALASTLHKGHASDDGVIPQEPDEPEEIFGETELQRRLAGR